MLVEDLLHYSPLRLISTAPQTLVSETAQRMAHYNIGFVVVMDDDDKVVGVLSERDIVKGFGDEEHSIEEAIVGDLMTESVITVSPTASVIDTVHIMNTHSIRHLLVVQAGKPVGVVSIRDLLRVFANQLLKLDGDTDDGDTDDGGKMGLVRNLAAI